MTLATDILRSLLTSKLFLYAKFTNYFIENAAQRSSCSHPSRAIRVPVEAEPDDYDGQDSAYSDGEPESSTTSMRSSILKFREENGRTYHSYKENEKDRLDLQHRLFSLTFDGKLTIVPIPKKKTIHRVLDVGTGTGIWAVDWADEHPESYVIGVDLSPIQPVFVPPNLSFEVDDLEEDWTFSQKFNFIHARMMVGSFADWPKFFAQSFEFLNPDGYIEVTDICFPAKTDDDSWSEHSTLRKWNKYMLQSCHNLGRFSDSQIIYPRI